MFVCFLTCWCETLTIYLKSEENVLTYFFFHTFTTSMFDWIEFVSFTQIKNYQQGFSLGKRDRKSINLGVTIQLYKKLKIKNKNKKKKKREKSWVHNKAMYMVPSNHHSFKARRTK